MMYPVNPQAQLAKAIAFFTSGQPQGQNGFEYFLAFTQQDMIRMLSMLEQPQANITEINLLFEQLENGHTFIQWLFPTTEESPYNRLAPHGFNQTHVQALKANEISVAQERLRQNFKLMLGFYGLKYTNGQVEKIAGNSVVSFNVQGPEWISKPQHKHNHLRISRMMDSLELFGLQQESQALRIFMVNLATREFRSELSAALPFWQKQNSNSVAYNPNTLATYPNNNTAVAATSANSNTPTSQLMNALRANGFTPVQIELRDDANRAGKKMLAIHFSAGADADTFPLFVASKTTGTVERDGKIILLACDHHKEFFDNLNLPKGFDQSLVDELSRNNKSSCSIS